MCFLLIIVSIISLCLIIKVLTITLKSKRKIFEKHVCITGGSSGIGKEVAILAARNGAHVTIIARNKDRLSEALKEIKKEAINPDKQIFKAISINCCDKADVTKNFAEIDNELPIYMLVNCAGMALCGLVEDMTYEVTKDIIDINYYSVLFPIQTLIPLMKKRGDGVIVITGSQGGLCGIYGYSIYASAKFALRGLAETIRMELKDFNISVTLALPPDTDTPGFITENISKPLETKLISNAAGLFKPEDIAKSLLSDALAGNFFSTVGFESWILTTFCVGMTDINFYDNVLQSFVIGLLRFVSYFYVKQFQTIVTKCKRDKEISAQKGINKND